MTRSTPCCRAERATLAGSITPVCTRFLYLSVWSAWSPYPICFAMTFVSCTARLPTRLLFLLFGLALDGYELLLGSALNDGQHFILFHDEVLLAIQLDLLARILAEQDPVARFDVEGDPLAVVFHLPIAGGDDRALL